MELVIQSLIHSVSLFVCLFVCCYAVRYLPCALAMHPDEQEPCRHLLQPPGTTFTGGFFLFIATQSPP
jgi:hypothetical protein